MDWYQRNKFNILFNNIIIEDYKHIYFLIQKNNFLFLLLLIAFVPIVFFFLSIYSYIVIFFILIFSLNVIFFYLESFLFINEQYEKIIIYKFPNSNETNIFIVIIKTFIDMAQKQAFMLVYLFLKKKKLLTFKNFLITLINFVIKIIFFIIFGYSVKVVKITSIFLNIFFKNLKKRNKINTTLFFENLFIDFILIYNDHFDNFVKVSKIIITNHKISLNPKNHTELMLSLLNSKFKLSQEDLKKIAECLQIIKDNSDVRYTVLRQEVDKQYPGAVKIDENGNFYVGETIPHTSYEIPYKKNTSILYRETKQLNVSIKQTIFENGEIKEVNSFLQTGFPNTGSINQNLKTYKTPTIEAQHTNIYELNNTKLLNNIRNGLVNKNDFLNQLVGSIFKPVYIFDKGNLYKDPTYLNLYEKITKEFSVYNNKNELMCALNDVVQIWHNHYDKFADIPNNHMMESIIKFIVSNTNYVIDPITLQMISDWN